MTETDNKIMAVNEDVNTETDTTESAEQPLVVVVNLTKKFGDLLVLDDISETVYEGEKVVAVGRRQVHFSQMS